MLSQIPCGFQRQTSGLLCNAFTIKEHITFSREEGMLVFGPPFFIVTFCVLAICFCYGCVYLAALSVSMALKCSNHQANRTVGFYLLMFLLQLALNISFVILTVMGKRKASSCRTVGSLVTPLLITIPPCINAAFFLVRDPQIKRLLFSAYRQKRRSGITAEVEVFQRGRRDDETGGHACTVEHQGQVVTEDDATTPSRLPGHVFPSISEDLLSESPT